MNETFRSAGVIAGTEKRFQVFSTPAANATSEMNAMYGKVICSILTVRSNLAGSAANPGAERYTISDAPAMPRTAATTSARPSSVATPSMRSLVSSREVLFFCPARTGTNAWESAPSANSRRSRLGMRKATKKASVAGPAPKARAITKSRT